MDSTPSPEISFEDFLKVDIRAGTIVTAEEVPKSKKLLKLEVDFGTEIGRRQILAGIKMSVPKNEDGTYNVTAFVGYQAMFVVNLAPREMMGLQSHGMILAALNAEGGIVCPGTHGTLLPNGGKFG